MEAILSSECSPTEMQPPLRTVSNPMRTHTVTTVASREGKNNPTAQL